MKTLFFIGIGGFMNSTGFNYRIIAHQTKGCTLETALKKKFKKALNIFLIIAVGIILTLSVIAATKWLTFDTVYTQRRP